jgi:hypothetical protein
MRAEAIPSEGYAKQSRRRPKGYALWSPRPETRRVLEQIEAVLTEYRDYLPMTNRQIYYRLVGAFGYSKTERGYAYLNRARRSGLIPFESIRDDGISVMSANHFGGEDEFYSTVRSLGESYTVDKLARQRTEVRVYCEAAGLLPQIARVSRRYSVPVYSCSGFDSLTAKHELAEDCALGFTYRGKRTAIIHLGDFDPSGVSIFESMTEDVRTFVSKDISHLPAERICVFERAALTREQVETFDLETAPAKTTDSRSGSWQGETCQLEALTPGELAGIVERSIERYLDLDTYEADLKEEVTSRRNIVRALPGGTA